MKPIPKSLHTVTALVNLSRHLKRDPAIALAILGYAGAADTYALADKARAILAKGAR